MCVPFICKVDLSKAETKNKNGHFAADTVTRKLLMLTNRAFMIKQI